MKKLLTNLKKYYPFVLNTVVPILIFFTPVYTIKYIDGLETITFYYNFYNLFDFSLDSVFAAFLILISLCIILNLIFFIIYMFDSYKLFLYKNMLNKILLVLSFIISISSLVILIYSIYISTLSNSVIFVYKNNFHIGSILLFIYSISQTIIITLKYRKKQF